MTDGIFGDMFDCNNDGELDAMEQGMEYMFLQELTDEEESKNDEE